MRRPAGKCMRDDECCYFKSGLVVFGRCMCSPVVRQFAFVEGLGAAVYGSVSHYYYAAVYSAILF